MKKKLLMLSLLTLASSMYGKDPYDELPIVVIPQKRIEKSAYEDLLRVIDETNRKNGIKSNYLEKGASIGRTTEGIDIVPIAQFTYGGKASEVLTGRLGFYNKETYHNIQKLVDQGTDALDNKEELSFVGVGNSKRFYFGSGNTVKDIIFENTNNIEQRINTEKNKKNDKYIITGAYQEVDSKINQLDISMEEWSKNIKNKSKEEVLSFLKQKLKSKKNIDTILKNGELFTQVDGEEWKVLWNIEAVRTRDWQGVKPIVHTEIYTFKPYGKFDEVTGKVLYTKDSSIFLEDNQDYSEKLRIVEGYNETGKLIEDLSKDSNFKKYGKDKEKLKKGEISQDDFNNKWITPFIPGGEYDKALKKMLAESKKFRKEAYDKKLLSDNLKRERKLIEKDKEFPEDYYKAINGRNFTNFNEEYMKTLTSRQKELVIKYYNNRKIDEPLLDEIIELEDKVVGIEKNNGFYNGYGSKGEEGKWLNYVIKDQNILIQKKQKNIEFRGQGRIEGTIDLGEGYNKLKITENFTGQYGTNIILGPYAKLKNINIVEVGGQIGNDDQASLSGKHSLSFDIDKNIKNERGELIQHAFRDSDKNIEFVSANSITNHDINNFAIELMVSRLDEDSIINMGRKLTYESRNLRLNSENLYIQPEKLFNVITFDSDSVAHELKLSDKKDSQGNSLLEVKIKDEIKGLDNINNQVYKSIKDSKQVSVLFPTLSATNKKTIFGGVREAESVKELNLLTKQFSENNIYSRVNKISKNELDLFNTIPFNIEHSLSDGDVYTNGGYLSNRLVKDDFKGNINSAYGVYESRINKNLRLGVLFGGTTSNHSEIKNDKLDETTTDSKIKGQSFYLGAYGNKILGKDFNFINGAGIQYGEYKVDRNLKNNYQEMRFKGKSDVSSFNAYSGLTYTYKLKNALELGVKGILSYSFINQGDIKEDSAPLSMEISEQNFSYLDGELGVSLSKTLYGNKTISKLKGGVSTIYGLSGYDNKNLKGKISNSTSDFTILGNKERKDAIKVALNYDVERESGVTYGIEGNYIANDEKDDIAIGIKLGYKY